MSSFTRRIKIISVILLCISSVFAAVLGIDYGQQNIKAMVVSPQAPLEMVLTPESKRKDISGLAIKSLGDNGDIERFYGSAVGSISTRFPQYSLLHLRPLLGKTIDDTEVIDLYLKEHPGVNITKTSRNSLAIDVDGVEYPIEELVAMNIQELASRANALLKEKDSKTRDFVEQFTISIPEYYNQNQRNALLDVGTLLENSEGTFLINDGISVAINYALNIRDFEPGLSHYYVIYDMGSGSTKATLIRIEQPLNETKPLQIEVGGYGYDSNLGGTIITLEVADMIEDTLLEKYPKINRKDLQSDLRAKAKIIQAAEKAKLVLTVNAESSVSIESVIADLDFRSVVTKEELEKRLSRFSSNIVNPLNQALDDQFWDEDITISQLNGILLTGGSTRVPYVQQTLLDIVDEDKLLKSVNADESTVNGVTVRGIKLFEAFKTKPLNVTERSFYAYSVSVDGSSDRECVFNAGDVFPATSSMFVPVEDNEDGLSLALYENDEIINELAIDELKTFDAKDCPYGFAYNVTFQLTPMRTFIVDSVQGLCLQIEKEMEGASEVVTNNTKLNTIAYPSYSESNPTITALTSKERLVYANRLKELNLQDKKRFQLQEAKNLLEGTLYDTRNFITEEEVVTNGPATQLSTLSNLVEKYLEWLEDEADDASKSDINKRRKEIISLRDKIEVYLSAVGEPLDMEQFEGLLKNATVLSEKYVKENDTLEDAFAQLEEKIPSTILDVRKEYENIQLPSSMSKTIADWEGTLNMLNDAIASIQKLVGSSSFEKLDREELYEMKRGFESIIQIAEEKLTARMSAHEYRVREVNSLHQKKLRAQRRKAEKEKKSLEEAGKKSSTGESISEMDGVHMTSSSSSESITSSITTETGILHDEL
ncbi:hypothetical protein KAFR_0C04080 [Kazachstania africana CBS 2517]|uniref:Actin-like ATPase domain-containing protein n=1 Tax=Kazachstania africana (strain ATCC 22294 / BCRC 22015 / CBS 2517 / CECT 1963 / NBRC 1671 / NRRL Y-8276) TaxID=1071382 RepID=H2ASP9_KAZAF|nr:hypothetical protein KAFR_0C04080 [Kazachstania africana CBS 2517]CCF57399.1 hypothetical protein KAFR_0C04080 [Kazachstania africana CBS 2517]